MCNLKSLFFLVSVITKTPEALSNDGRHKEKLSSETTGYQYENGSIKCAYLYTGLTHMRLTALLPKETKHWAKYIHIIRNYNVKDTVASLYMLDVNLVGSLWDLYLYTSWLKEKNIHMMKNIIQQSKVKITQENVIESLENDTRRTKCREDNKFNQYKHWILKHPNPKPNDIIAMIRKNHVRNVMLVLKNNKSFIQMYQVKNALKLKKLFLNDLGINIEQKYKLLNFDAISVNWNGTIQLLEKAWNNIWSEFYLNVEHYQRIELYFTLHNNLLNIIIFRLSWRHLLCIDKILNENLKSDYATKLNTLLYDYQQMSVIQNDTTLDYLLNANEQIAKKNGDIHKTVFELQVKIEPICSSLNCSKNDFMTLEDKDLNTINKLNTQKINNISDLSNSQHSGTDPLKNVKNFLNLRREIFKDIHLGVTRSFISHVVNKLTE